jgi:hypothetical protein
LGERDVTIVCYSIVTRGKKLLTMNEEEEEKFEEEEEYPSRYKDDIWYVCRRCNWDLTDREFGLCGNCAEEDKDLWR